MVQQPSLNVRIPPELAAAIRAEVDRGAFPDAEAVVAHAVREWLLVGSEPEDIAALRAAWDEGIASGIDERPGPEIMAELIRRYSSKG